MAEAKARQEEEQRAAAERQRAYEAEAARTAQRLQVGWKGWDGRGGGLKYYCVLLVVRCAVPYQRSHCHEIAIVHRCP